MNKSIYPYRFLWRKIFLTVKFIFIFLSLSTYNGLAVDISVNKIISDNYISTEKEANNKVYEDALMPQQKRQITGTIVDEQGEPVIGANVIQRGTTLGTVTDADGHFTISVEDNATLNISYIGYLPKDINVAGRTSLRIVLEEDTKLLDEVVVVGYGTQIRRNVTGSVSRVDMSETENLPNTNFSQALRGRVAGLQFTDDGRPGQNGNITIRGPRSLNASNSPLIILDGIFFHGSKSDINPNDIESIEILKDASASAIYGSRAANGVILITTKRGTTEKPTIRINSFYGVLDWTGKLPLLGPEGYIQKTLDARRANGLSYNTENPELNLTPSKLENYRNGNIINPYDEISQPGRLLSSDISISGNTKNTNYYLSASFTNNQGLVYGDKEDKQTFRVNLENKITNWLTIGMNTMLSLRDQSGVPANIGATLHRQSPFGTWYHPDGEPTQFTIPEDEGISQNPMRSSLLTENKLLNHY